MIASWIFHTPTNLSLGANIEPDFSPRNLAIVERFITSSVRLSQFDQKGDIIPYQVNIDIYSLWNERILDWSLVNRIFLSIIREFRSRLRRYLNFRFSTVEELYDYMDEVTIIDKRDIMIIKKFLVLYNKFKSSVEITYIIQELKSILFNEQLINILNRFFGRIGRQLNLQMLTELGCLSQNDIKNLDYVTYQEKLEIERKRYS